LAFGIDVLLDKGKGEQRQDRLCRTNIYNSGNLALTLRKGM
jgi:hypothetical protein